MQKVVCINERNSSKLIEVGNTYFIDPSSISGDSNGDWYVDVYTNSQKEMWIGYFRLSHFKTVV